MLPPATDELPLVTAPVTCSAPPPDWLNVRLPPTVLSAVTVVVADCVLAILTAALPLLAAETEVVLTARAPPEPLLIPVAALRPTAAPVTVAVEVRDVPAVRVTAPVPPAMTAPVTFTFPVLLTLILPPPVSL